MITPFNIQVCLYLTLILFCILLLHIMPTYNTVQYHYPTSRVANPLYFVWLIHKTFVVLLFLSYHFYFENMIYNFELVTSKIQYSDKYTVVLQLLRTSSWYSDNCITKLWAHWSNFLYLYMVFLQHCFHLEQHCFHVLRTFQTDWV